MIEKLIDLIILHLEQAFGWNPSDNKVGREAFASDKPYIRLRAGDLEAGLWAKDESSSRPRPQPFREKKTTGGARVFALAKQPLKGSLLCQVIYDENTVDERRELVVEGRDFTINYQTNELTFDGYDPSASSAIALEYSFPGIYTIREFKQEFVLEFYDETISKREELAAIALAAVLTNHDELMEGFNMISKYNEQDYSTAHTLSDIQFMAGRPNDLKEPSSLQLFFLAKGQIKAIREMKDPAYLIDRIKSRNSSSGYLVDIEAKLG